MVTKCWEVTHTLMSYFTAKLEAEKYTVYCNTEMEAAATKKVAKALVDCKVMCSIYWTSVISL